MGNCLVLQQLYVVKMMKRDGKILQYKTPIKVEEVLPLPTPKVVKKVRFANPEVEDVEKSSVVRIKLVISKQKLQDMLENGGISVEKMLSLVHGENGILNGEDLSKNLDDDDDDVSRGWKPVLKTIPEVI